MNNKPLLAIEWLSNLLDKHGEYKGYGSPTHVTIAVMMQDYHSAALASLKQAGAVDLTAYTKPCECRDGYDTCRQCAAKLSAFSSIIADLLATRARVAELEDQLAEAKAARREEPRC